MTVTGRLPVAGGLLWSSLHVVVCFSFSPHFLLLFDIHTPDAFFPSGVCFVSFLLPQRGWGLSSRAFPTCGFCPACFYTCARDNGCRPAALRGGMMPCAVYVPLSCARTCAACTCMLHVVRQYDKFCLHMQGATARTLQR